MTCKGFCHMARRGFPNGRPAALFAAFLYFRKAWGPEAAARLAVLRHGAAIAGRQGALAWLQAARVPLSGEAPTLGLPGLPWGPFGHIGGQA